MLPLWNIFYFFSIPTNPIPEIFEVTTPGKYSEQQSDLNQQLQNYIHLYKNLITEIPILDIIFNSPEFTDLMYLQ